jgi:hypothetical protein
MVDWFFGYSLFRLSPFVFFVFWAFRLSSFVFFVFWAFLVFRLLAFLSFVFPKVEISATHLQPRDPETSTTF